MTSNYGDKPGAVGMAIRYGVPALMHPAECKAVIGAAASEIRGNERSPAMLGRRGGV